MINPKLFRDNPELIKAKLPNRGVSLEQIDEYIATDAAYLAASQAIETLKHERNLATPKRKPSDEERAKLGQLSDAIKEKEQECHELKEKRDSLALQFPNLYIDSTPIGDSEDDNVLIKEWGSPTQFDFSPKAHEDLASAAGIFHPEIGASISGSRFAVLSGAGAKLERALIAFMLEQHEQRGYLEMNVPALVHQDCMMGTGQLPKFADDAYHIEGSDLWLSSTGEIQLTNMFKKQVIPADQLPIKRCTSTPCFRKESGSYGKDMKGLIRLHQFTKVELVQWVHPDESEQALQSLLADAENILQLLKLPYRVVQLCTGDLGFSSANTYDLEVWFPSQNQYREISSCSNFLDFQSRRAMIRYKEDQQSPEYLHTLNGSGLAIGRTLAAILENYQTQDGIEIPEALHPYMNIKEISCPVSQTH